MKLISLFSGIGGLDIGASAAFEKHGIALRPSFFCEIDPYCRAILHRHFPAACIFHDVRFICDPPEADIVLMGFPCQDASILNRAAKGLDGPRTGLFFEGWRVAQESGAKIVIMENVAAFKNRGAAEVRKIAKAAGYHFEDTVVSAAHFGAPHLRKRWMGIAYKDDDIICPGWSERIPPSVSAPRLRWPTMRAGKTCGDSVERFKRARGRGHVSTPHIETAIWIAQERKGRMSIEWGERLMGFPVGYTCTEGPDNRQILPWGEDWDGDIPAQTQTPIKDRTKRLKALGNSVVPAWAFGVLDHALSPAGASRQLPLPMFEGAASCP